MPLRHGAAGTELASKPWHAGFFLPCGEKGTPRRAGRFRGAGVSAEPARGGLASVASGLADLDGYKVTREERHSTRVRAHLLQEMLRGETLRDGWRSEEVKQALDLCLACKGCLGECPVSVDIGTSKAEFLAHYYRHRLRPRAAWAMGGLPLWARLGSAAPRVANAVAKSHLGGALLRGLGGLAPERPLPRFAARSWTRSSGRASLESHGRGAPVLLWPDTFSNDFEPQVAEAAERVLGAAGFRVIVPRRGVCCGRPFYDFGMLGLARRALQRTLDVLGPELERETGPPVVVLEPSCLAVFRHELEVLLPDDPRAARLRARSRSLAELLLEEKVPLPALSGRALLHGPCHQKALWGIQADEALLAATGVELDLPDTGCCGLAGAFGFERGKYAASMAVGEQALLPALRGASDTTWLVADGFSCRTQVNHATGRPVLHLAQLLELGQGEGQVVQTAGP